MKQLYIKYLFLFFYINLPTFIDEEPKKLNIPENNIQFVDDYSKMHSFNAEQLRYSDRYSDIIIGPTPHSIKNKGGFSSIIAMIENNPKEYPKLLKAIANNSLKITTSNFKELLQQTRYYQEAI